MNRLSLFTLIAAIPLAVASAQTVDSLQIAVDKALKPSVFRGVPSSFGDVHASVLNGVVTLTGFVDTYDTKLDAEAHVSRINGVSAIQDNLLVAGPIVSDAVLQSRLEHRMRTNAVSVAVHNGVVELAGQHVDPEIASAAFSIAAKTPGVHAVVNRMDISRWSSAGPELGPMPYTISSVP